MQIADLITLERISCNAHANSKKRALEMLSTLLSSSSQRSSDEIFDSLVNRERLGSTGLGHGVAIPHARLSGNEFALGAFIKLDAGVDFDAVDNQPVDLLFSLLVPEHFTDEHLQILAQLAKLFSSDRFRDALRQCEDEQQLYDLLCQSPADSDTP